MVLHSWEFWKPVSRAMVRHLGGRGDKPGHAGFAFQEVKTGVKTCPGTGSVQLMNSGSWIGFYVWIRSSEASPVPGLAYKSCQEEAQAVTNEGEESPDDPEGWGNDPGGLVQDPPDHGDNEDQKEARDGAHLQWDQSKGSSGPS